MSVSPTGLDLSPWFILVCIHFPRVFSWISPVTLRTCIQCWWQKSKSAGDITKNGGVAVSSVSLKHHTRVSYTLYHTLLNIFWNLRYTTAKICAFIKTGESYVFSGEVNFKVLETISVLFNVSGWGFFILSETGHDFLPFCGQMVSRSYKDNGWISFGISAMSLFKRSLDISGLC